MSIVGADEQPDLVLSRGRPVIDGGKFVGRPGAGQFLKRATR